MKSGMLTRRKSPDRNSEFDTISIHRKIYRYLYENEVIQHIRLNPALFDIYRDGSIAPLHLAC